MGVFKLDDGPNAGKWMATGTYKGHPVFILRDTQREAEGSLQRLQDGDDIVTRGVSLDNYTSVGSYPLAYLAGTDVLCPECAFEDVYGGRSEVEAFINYEDADLYCESCNERIPSAYGEAEEE